MGGAAVLPVQVVGVFPDVEGQDGPQAAGDGVAGAGLLGDLQGAVGGGGKPYPAAAEKACALGLEVGFEGVHATPLLFYSGDERSFAFAQDDRIVQGDRSVILRLAEGSELGEVEVMVQDLAGVVEDWEIAGRSRQ